MYRPSTGSNRPSPFVAPIVDCSRAAAQETFPSLPPARGFLRRSPVSEREASPSGGRPPLPISTTQVPRGTRVLHRLSSCCQHVLGELSLRILQYACMPSGGSLQWTAGRQPRPRRGQRAHLIPRCRGVRNHTGNSDGDISPQRPGHFTPQQGPEAQRGGGRGVPIGGRSLGWPRGKELRLFAQRGPGSLSRDSRSPRCARLDLRPGGSVE